MLVVVPPRDPVRRVVPFVDTEKSAAMTAVTDHLTELGIRFQVLPHAPSNTAMGEALALGVPAEDVAKAVLLDVDDGHVLAVVPASRKVDLDLVCDALGEDHVHLASEAEVARDFPAYELGALPPLPSLLRVPVVIDPTLLVHPRATFAAGTQDTSIRADGDDVFVGPAVTVSPISRAYTGPTSALAT